MKRRGTVRKESESVRISGRVKRRLQRHCRQRGLTLRDALDEAVRAYVQKRGENGGT